MSGRTGNDKSISAHRSAEFPITVRVERAVQLTGIGRTKLYELIGSGAIESVKIGRSRYVIVASLVGFIEKLPRS